MIHEETLRTLEFHEYQIIGWSEYYSRILYGKIVTLKTGKYKGRKARIEGCIPCHKHGFVFCCYVLRKDGSILNTDGQSRQYRPRVEFELTSSSSS